MRIAFLHLAPIPGALDGNRALVETAFDSAAGAGANWIITPELATTGYEFAEHIGTAWIETQPDAWVRRMASFARKRSVVAFLSVPEREGPHLFNSLIAIDHDGEIVGRHRKINTLRGGAESWSTPGNAAHAIPIDKFGLVGMLICADAFSPEIAASLVDQGARALVSSAAWAPGLNGPAGEWEAVSGATSRPVFVCNRTGKESQIDFSAAESVVAIGGERKLSFSSATNAILLVDWNFAGNELVGYSQMRLDR